MHKISEHNFILMLGTIPDHHHFFPSGIREWISVILCLVGGILSSAAGTGGGGFYNLKFRLLTV